MTGHAETAAVIVLLITGTAALIRALRRLPSDPENPGSAHRSWR